MYGDLAMKLVADAKRTASLDHLPAYQSEVVRGVVREMKALESEQQRLLEAHGGAAHFDHTEHPEAAVQILVQHISKQRNKRCLLAYLKQRTKRIENLCWAETLDLTASASGSGAEEIVSSSRDLLGPEEQDYARRYTELLAAFKGQLTDIDLTGSVDPPRDLYVDVRVLKDAGEVQTEYGSMLLTKDSTFFARFSDVERLIRQGFLQRIG
ncbi:DNA replication protein psf1 [Savitreella phatthalungensis]